MLTYAEGGAPLMQAVVLWSARPLASSNGSLYYPIYTDTAYVSRRQHTSAYISRRQHTAACTTQFTLIQYLIYYLQAGVLLSAAPLASSNGSSPAQVC